MQALVKDIVVSKNQVTVEFRFKENNKESKVHYPKVEKYKELLKKKNQWIQVKVVLFHHSILIFPTFFDFPSRCKKCGRFYKIYCKSCHQKLGWINMIMDRFVEETGVKEDFSDFYKTKEEERNDCDPAPAGPQEE